MRTTRLTAGLLSLVLLGGGVTACDEDAQEAHDAPGEAGQSANTEKKVTGDAAVSSKLPPGSEDSPQGGAGAAATEESGTTAEAGEQGDGKNGDGSAEKDGTPSNNAVETGDMDSAGHSDRVWQGEKDPVWSEDKGGAGQ